MNERIRILHCLRAPVGGLFRHVLDLSEEQAALGHDVGIVMDASIVRSRERTAARRDRAPPEYRRIPHSHGPPARHRRRHRGGRRARSGAAARHRCPARARRQGRRLRAHRRPAVGARAPPRRDRLHAARRQPALSAGVPAGRALHRHGEGPRPLHRRAHFRERLRRAPLCASGSARTSPPPA